MTALAEAGEDVRAPAEWLGEIGVCERRRTAAILELEAVIAERRTLAPAAAAGDRAAQARLAWLNVRSGELSTELDWMSAGRDIAAERLAEVLEANQRGGEMARKVDAAAVERALLCEARKIDTAMRALKQAITARETLIRRLGSIRAGNKQLGNPNRLLGAAHHAGLADHLDIGRCAPRLHAPLVASDRVLLRTLQAAPTSDETVDHEREVVG